MAKKFGTTTSWQGIPVTTKTGDLDALRDLLQPAQRVPFEVGGVNNPRMDLILNDQGYPIGTVAKDYALVQHLDVFNRAVDALNTVGFTSGLTAEVQLSENAEWMRANFTLKGFDFTPTDGHPMILRLAMSNSINAKTSVMSTMEWLRLICGNALMATLGGAEFRKAHTQGMMDGEVLVTFLKEALEAVPQNQGKLQEWEAAPIEGNLKDWVIDTVEPLWGQKTAARAYAVMTSGYDGSVAQITEAEKPTANALTRVVRREVVVPGQAKVAETALDVANGLSWLVRTGRSEQAKNYRLRQLPHLVENLAFGTPLSFKGHFDQSGRGYERED